MVNPVPALQSVLRHTGSIVWLLIHTIEEIGDATLRGRRPLRLANCFQQADRAGVGSVPLVALVSFFIGLTMALLTGYQLRTFGQEQLVPPLVGIAFTRELGPLMTGIMLAARIGAAYTAELGTMTVAEEVEAIEAMGIGPLRYLVSPRLLAVFLLMPCLVVISDMTAMGGAALISRWAFDIPFSGFFDSAFESMLVRDLVAGLLKSFLFGLIIGLVSCYKGLTVRGGAAGVGDATTSSVVTAITTVIGFDTLFNVVLVALFE
ncbi:MAG: phospholipid/cholesterol/gamma-HCH transport system permease protein [Chthoniobacter sp.]|jgi:phospholipid/cholesterol/gamma-HCH transport system permease protein|nr:phospholipid/cholesterol/gamma-HCH transport system permease protein [Chthoniobacter sp.]